MLSSAEETNDQKKYNRLCASCYLCAYLRAVRRAR